ncbi:glycosyltransferase family 25 protein [Acinetobacter thermotolerans]|uniref:glycosyltransferase family 25 protein n=1 Tax=Acinetobacter thermotolerans TaxID=3151487 RepID=UPI00325C24D7
MKTFIISIEEENSPRLNKFLSQPFFQKDHLTYEKVGVKGGDLSAKEYFELGVKGRSRPLSPSMVGCTLSHLEAMRKFLDSSEDFALILEDDAILPNDFSADLLEQQLNQMQLSPQFLFSIGGIQMKECRKVRGDIKDIKLLNASVLEVHPDFYHRICYTVSYVVDREMAKALIEYHKVLRAADDWRYIPDMYPSSRIYMAFIVDHPELEANVIDPSLSTIQAERVGSTDVPVSKYGSSIRYNIGKFLWKKYPL